MNKKGQYENNWVKVIVFIFIVIVFVVVLALAIQYEKGMEKPCYKFNGQSACCSSYYRNYCGVHLSKCDNGIQYDCVTNLERLP